MIGLEDYWEDDEIYEELADDVIDEEPWEDDLDYLEGNDDWWEDDL